jgi:transglutaminase-like putative cysteine protease
MRMRRLGLGVGIVVAGAAVGALAFGQVSPKKRVLHEDLPAPAADADSPMIGEDPRAGKNPAAFSSGDKVLPEPSSDPSSDDEPVLGRGGFAADRETQTTPDDQTGADGTLHYVSVFNPDVLPFKRMTAMDTVRDDYTLAIGDATLRELPVGGKSDPSRDRFWGSILVELEPGRDVPLPSVAPDMRILSYEANPSVTLVFSKDRADNFSVRTDDPAAHGTFRVVFLVDADAGYFAPALPARSYSLGDVRAAAEQKGLLPSLPADVAAEARRSLKRMNVERDEDLESAFNTLVFYFRGFTAKTLDSRSGLLYRDLVDHQAGVCRHRSYAFIITALAAGIPTRYVTNEAHAFVEVWFPDRGWQRIDLGGAALRLEVENGEGKTLHRPRREDPFDKPPEYSEQYTQLDGDIKGLSEEQIDERRAPLGDGSSGDYGPLVDGTGPDADDGAGSGSGDAVAPGDEVQARAPDPKKLTPTVTVTRSDDAGYRGEAVEVEGRVDADGGPLVGVRVDVFIAPYGHGGNDGRLIGRGVTEADGRFVVDADLPGDLDLATYEIFVTTPETDQLNAAQSF